MISVLNTLLHCQSWLKYSLLMCSVWKMVWPWSVVMWSVTPGKEYGQADARYLVSDPTVVSIEMLTAFLLTPVCVVLAYAVCQQSPFRHWLQLVLCTCELYGGCFSHI